MSSRLRITATARKGTNMNTIIISVCVYTGGHPQKIEFDVETSKECPTSHTVQLCQRTLTGMWSVIVHGNGSLAEARNFLELEVIDALNRLFA